MRIALVTREYPPETAWGGIGAFYVGYARALAEAGHEVEVFTQGLEADAVLEQDGIRVTRVLGLVDGLGAPTPGSEAGNSDLGLFALGLAQAFNRALKRRHRQVPFDVVEGHEHLGVTALINGDADIGALKVVRYLTAYHSLVKRGLVHWPASTLIEALERAAIQRADVRISVSDNIDGVVMEDFDAPKADATIPLFVNAPAWEGRWAAKKKQMLFVGRLVLNLKRPDVAIGAFCRFADARPDWNLVLVGLDQSDKGILSVWEHLKAQIPARMRRRITHLGGQPSEEVYRLMGESRAMIMPSDFESFGMVAIEAMQHGCLPFVASNTGTVDVVPDPRLIRQQASTEDFARGLEEVFGEATPDEAEALSARVVAHARTNFSVGRIVADVSALFERTGRGIARPGDTPRSTIEDGPLVSVVVPNFNGGRHLKETLTSITAQDYPHFEVILVDGGSTDDSLDIAAAFPEVRVISQSDTGQAHAINRGLLEAGGDILAYLNADDVYRPGALRTVVEHFQGRPDSMLVCGACDYIDERSRVTGEPIRPLFPGVEGMIRYWGWERWYAIPQMSCFWRREVVERVGLFDSSLHYVMDLDYWIRAARLFDIATVPQTLAAFRLAPGTKTVSATDRMYAEEYATFLRYRDLLPPNERSQATRDARRHYSGKLLGWGEHMYLTEHQRRRGLAEVQRALAVDAGRWLDPRVWFLFANAGASLVGQGGVADRVHHRLLAALPRPAVRG